MPGNKTSFQNFLQNLHSVRLQVLTACHVPWCSRCWGNESNRTNRVPVFLEFGSCFEDIANKQINKKRSDGIKCYDKNKTGWWGRMAAAAAAKSLQSCPTLCDPIDGSPLGSPVHGILQARTLEWVAIAFSNAEKWKVKVKSLSRVRLLATPWTAAYQAPPSMVFSRQEYWSGVPLPSPRSSYAGIKCTH